jgi:hypothetical protein
MILRQGQRIIASRPRQYKEIKMAKQPSVITIAKTGNMYRIDTRGAFGGGWQLSATEAELAGAITRAWQQYGSNPLGCEIIGDLPQGVKELADRLMSLGQEGNVVITLRIPTSEADAIRSAAEKDDRSVNQWARLALKKAAE